MTTDSPAFPHPLNSTFFDWNRIAAVSTPVGECRNFFDSATRTLARMECHATTLRAGERSHEAHQHADEELIFIKEGQLEVSINGRVEVATAGAVLFFASMDWHGLRNPGNDPATYFVVRIFPRDLAAS